MAHMVKNVGGCVVIYGSVPVAEYTAIIQKHKDSGFMMDARLANAMNANTVMGTIDDLNNLRQQNGLEKIG